MWGSFSFLIEKQIDPKKHPYASDKPIANPKSFEIPGVKNAYHITFTPDGNAFYFISGNTMELIYYTEFQNGKWSNPKITEFSGKYRIETPSLSPDGKRFFFRKMSVMNNKDISEIYFMDKTDSGWSNPTKLSPLLSNNEGSVTCASNGNIYFYSETSEGQRLYCSKWINSSYSKPEKLDIAIDKFYVSTCYIVPDESMILFDTYEPPDIFTLYISFNKNGSWTIPKNMGPIINTKDYQGRPCVSPDGNYLFFTRYDSLHTKVTQYQVDFKPLLESIK